MLHSINYCMCVFLKFICIYFFLYYRGLCVRKLFTGLIMYLPSQNKEHCIVLYCIVLYCIVLYCIVLYCIVLYCIVLYCIVLYCIVLYCIVRWTLDTSVQLPHECFCTFNFKGLLGHSSLLPDTHHSSDVPFIVLGNLDCFPLVFTKEGSNVVTACDCHEFTPIRAVMKQRMKIAGPSCIDIFIFLVFVPLLFFRQYFSKSRFSYIWSSSRTKTSVSSGCIRHVITRRMPSMKNHERISLFVSNFRSSESLKIRKRPRKSQRTL